jgi:ribosomal protein S18 acetylase RimI-like enzyme/ketosteroid isomerase-like protein
MHIALLQAADAVRYRGLMLQAYALAADAFTSTPEERAAEPEVFWVRRIADPTGLSVSWGAFADQALVGTVTLEFSAKPKTRHKAHVIGMYVAPQARGSGAGRALLMAAVEFAQARDGIMLLNLTVTDGNEPAIKLYRSMGFEAFGLEPMAICTPSGFKAKVLMQKVIRRGAQQVLEDFFAAINRHDLQALAKDLDPQIVRFEPEGFPGAGSYRGIQAVLAHVATGRGTWAEGRCQPEGFFAKGDKWVVYLHARVRLHGASDWVGGRFADGFEFRDGKIAQYLSFAERADALKWAGIEA